MTRGSAPGRNYNLPSTHTHSEVNPEVYGPSRDLQMDGPERASIWPPTDHRLSGRTDTRWCTVWSPTRGSIHPHAAQKGVNMVVKV